MLCHSYSSLGHFDCCWVMAYGFNVVRGYNLHERLLTLNNEYPCAYYSKHLITMVLASSKTHKVNFTNFNFTPVNIATKAPYYTLQ